MNALIIANGTLPQAKIVRKLLGAADYIICADGGANHARRLRIKPDIILGDLDSITPSTRKYFHDVEILYIPDQCSTDLEKAVRLCIANNIASVDILGATGSRIDHSTGSLGCFKKFGKRIEMRIHDTNGTISAVRKSTHLKVRKGEKISLIPLERCIGITTKNLLYPLKNESLELGVREGTSNQATAKHLSISVKKGMLLLYRFHAKTQEKLGVS